jgi:hypothetical protein
MKKLFLLATAAFLVTGVAMAGNDKGKKKKCCKTSKACCKKSESKSCSKDSKTAEVSADKKAEAGQ